MPKSLEIEAGTDGTNGLIFLYLQSNDPKQKSEIQKAFESLDPFSTKVNDYPYYNKIKEHLSEYEKDEDFQESIELGKTYLDNFIKYGYCHWYNWSVENWGTKWNVEDEVSVIDLDNGNYEIRFDTAWSVPIGILKKFGAMCNDGELDWMFYDEDYDGHIFVTKENGKLMLTKKYLDIDVDNDVKI